MSYQDPSIEIDLEKDIESDIDVDTDIDFDVDVYKDVDVYVDVYSDADIWGNTANLTATVEAVGCDTLAELDFTATTIEDQLSEISVVAVSAVN